MSRKKSTKRERLAIETLERREMMAADFGSMSKPYIDAALAYVASPIPMSQWNANPWQNTNLGQNWFNPVTPLYSQTNIGLNVGRGLYNYNPVNAVSTARPDYFQQTIVPGAIHLYHSAHNVALAAFAGGTLGMSTGAALGLPFGPQGYVTGAVLGSGFGFGVGLGAGLTHLFVGGSGHGPSNFNYSKYVGPSAKTNWLNPTESARFQALDNVFNNLGSTAKTSSSYYPNVTGMFENATVSNRVQLQPKATTVQRSTLSVTPVQRYNPNLSPMGNAWNTKPAGSYTVPPLIRW